MTQDDQDFQEIIRELEDRREAREERDHNIGRHLGTSATAPPPAASRVTPNFGGQPQAAFETPPLSNQEDYGKLLAEIRDMIQQVLERLDEGPAQAGFDKKGKFRPGGPGRIPEATSKKDRTKNEFMQAALSAFVHNLRTS